MALVCRFEETEKERNTVHGSVECGYLVFQDKAGRRYLQLDTYGSKERKLPDKVSQSLQLDEQAARELVRIIEKVFPIHD